MSGDLQSLLEKINTEGVEKANAEAAKIVAEAKAAAADTLAKAEAEAAKTRADAQRDADAFAARAKESVRQAARDVVLEVGKAVETLLVNLLKKNVEAALADEKTAAALAADAVKDVASGAKIAAPAKLAAALKAQLAAEKSVEIVVDEAARSGFSVRIDGGRVEHSFTPEMVAGELARRLRPELAALLK